MIGFFEIRNPNKKSATFFFCRSFQLGFRGVSVDEGYQSLGTLPEQKHLKMDGWKMILSFGDGLFLGGNC